MKRPNNSFAPLLHYSMNARNADPLEEKNRTTIKNLPSELLFQILECVYYTKTHRPDYRAMALYSLISKAWAPLAQRLLFHEVCLSQAKQVRALKRAISRTTKRGKYLGNSVRILDFNPVYWLDFTGGITVSQLESLFALCPGLYEISIGFDHVKGLSSGVISDWQKKAPPIKSLRISNVDSRSSSVVTQMVGIWPSVQFLSIKGEAFSQNVPDDPLSLNLTEFGWYGRSKPEDGYLKWLLSSSDNTLRAFHVAANGSEYPMKYHALNPVALSHSAHLRSLRVPGITAPQLRLFRRLEELVLFDQLQFRRDVMEALPQSISHISFILTIAEELMTLSVMVLKPFPNLRAITCFSPGIPPRGPATPTSLQYEFGLKNVDLIFYEGGTIVQQGLKDDEVPGFRPPGVPIRNYPGFPSVEAMRARNQAISDRVAEYEARAQQKKSRLLGIGRLLSVLKRKSGIPQLR